MPDVSIESVLSSRDVTTEDKAADPLAREILAFAILLAAVDGLADEAPIGLYEPQFCLCSLPLARVDEDASNKIRYFSPSNAAS